MQKNIYIARLCSHCAVIIANPTNCGGGGGGGMGVEVEDGELVSCIPKNS